jgi:hypothetical protein
MLDYIATEPISRRRSTMQLKDKPVDELDLVKEFERLVSEGGRSEPPTYEVTLEPRYNCEKGYHKWAWYNGFTDCFYHCTMCPAKDRKRPRPPSRS